MLLALISSSAATMAWVFFLVVSIRYINDVDECSQPPYWVTDSGRNGFLPHGCESSWQRFPAWVLPVQRYRHKFAGLVQPQRIGVFDNVAAGPAAQYECALQWQIPGDSRLRRAPDQTIFPMHARCVIAEMHHHPSTNIAVAPYPVRRAVRARYPPCNTCRCAAPHGYPI